MERSAMRDNRGPTRRASRISLRFIRATCFLGEHDAEVADSVHRGIAVIRDGRRREKAGEFEPPVAVRRAHHGNLDALIAQSSNASGPFSFDRGTTFELKAEFVKKINRPFEVIDDNSNIVHPFEAPFVPTCKVSINFTIDRFDPNPEGAILPTLSYPANAGYPVLRVAFGVPGPCSR
jgi:hypothetical protein